MEKITISFPGALLWGTATSAFQIEGASHADGKGPSIWDEFCSLPGRILDGGNGQVACDHYHRFREDVELMARLGLDAYRFSVSWPRVMPTGRQPTNPAGLDFYDRLVDALVAANIQPMVTLYHWDLPQALQRDLGGWVHDDLPHLFADYAEVMFDRLGDRVRLWITINEPWCVVDGGYFNGVHAPGIRNREQGYRAGHNLLRAHAYAVQRFRQRASNPGQISLAINTHYAFPETDSPEDVAAAQRSMIGMAGWFADPIYFGDYPREMRERLGSLLPAFSADDTALLTRSIDYFSLNYYLSQTIRHAPGASPMDCADVPQEHLPHTEMGWAVVPEGLHLLLNWLSGRYPGLPFYITENGAAMADQPDETGKVDDPKRIDYFEKHLSAAAQAMADGVDLRGYFAWSLLDNFEWSYGCTKRFGLVYTDFNTQKRTIKSSGDWYANLIRRCKDEHPASARM